MKYECYAPLLDRAAAVEIEYPRYGPREAAEEFAASVWTAVDGFESLLVEVKGHGSWNVEMCAMPVFTARKVKVKP